MAGDLGRPSCLVSSIKELTSLSGVYSEGGQTVKSGPPLTNTIQTGPSLGLGQVGAIRPGLPGRQLTATVSGLSSVDLPAQTGPRYRMEPRTGPNGTAGTNSQPGPAYGPHGTPGHFLYNNRPAIISLDSGLTPEVGTRSSPQGDFNEQPMEVSDTMYPTSSGMVKPTRVVPSPLASNMAGIMPLQHDDPNVVMPPPGYRMFPLQGDHAPVSGYRVPSLTPAPFKGPDLGSTHLQDLTSAPPLFRHGQRQHTAPATITSGDMTSSQANQWQTHPVTTSPVSTGNPGLANLSQPGMVYPTNQGHISAPDTHPQSFGTGLPSTQSRHQSLEREQAIHTLFPDGIPQGMEHILAPNLEPDYGSQFRFGAQSSLDSAVPLSELRGDVQSRYPDYQFNDPVVIPKPRSLGLANFCQAQPDKQANLPLSPSLHSWLDLQSNTLEGKDRHGKVFRAPFGPRTFPKLPPLRASRYAPSDTPSLLRQSALPTEWERLLRDRSKSKPDAVQLTSSDFSDIISSSQKMICLLSDLDWWLAGVSNLIKEAPEPSPSEPEQVSRHLFSQRYLLESCKTLEEMQLQASTLFSHLKWKERDTYLSKLHSSIPACTKQALRNSSLTGQYLFDEQLVSGAVDKLQGDVSLISNTHMLDRLSSARGGYQPTKRAGAKRQAPQAMAQVDSSFQKKAKPHQPFHGQQPFRGQGQKAKSQPGSYNRGRGRGAGKSGRGGH